MSDIPDIASAAESVSPEEVPHSLTKAEILVVDDSRMMRAGLTRSL